MFSFSCTKESKNNFVWFKKMVNSRMNVFPNTRAWEPQEWNKTKRQTMKVRRDTWTWKEVTGARKKEIPTTLPNQNQNTILINLIWHYFTRYGKVQWNSINKNKMNLNNWKMANHPPSSVCNSVSVIFTVVLLFNKMDWKILPLLI